MVDQLRLSVWQSFNVLLCSEINQKNDHGLENQANEEKEKPSEAGFGGSKLMSLSNFQDMTRICQT